MAETDARLVERARAGDGDAFDQLVRRHMRAAYSVALAVMGEPADAEDVCQDALVTALERLDECRDPSRFAAWMLRIVRNRAHDLLRFQAVRRTWSLDGNDPPDGSNPGTDAERAELRERLQAGLAGLTETQREVVLLHDLEGWRHREIAEALGIAEGTARYHLSHARRVLRDRLGTGLQEEIQGEG